ncbi:hypothetical protein CHF27_010140 [Romboutsia maritimum]|uniref:Uncharacterized protein n=1 Tax=Romboutsia maritimum TaxID=2020948 RepID=A0A371IRC3_9FIRM|nr:hypothetical protein [Romboutsia maritimum]RDY23031.1 hypothetical protein CHF27_010140 [Romboutsia maritimum]
MYLSGILVLVSSINIFTNENKNKLFKFINVIILLLNIIILLSGLKIAGNTILDVTLLFSALGLMSSYFI